MCDLCRRPRRPAGHVRPGRVYGMLHEGQRGQPDLRGRPLVLRGHLRLTAYSRSSGDGVLGAPPCALAKQTEAPQTFAESIVLPCLALTAIILVAAAELYPNSP